MKRYFKGHEITIVYNMLGGFSILCFKLDKEKNCVGEKIFEYADNDSENIYEAMNKAKIKIGRL